MIAQSRNHKWLQQHDEAILEPELPIIDPHHHLWDKNSNHLVQPRYLLDEILEDIDCGHNICLLYTSPSPRDRTRSRMPSSA